MRAKFKIWLILMIFGISFQGNTQQDTLEISSWELSDSIYGNLTTHVNTGFLFNRTLLDTNEAFVYNTDKTNLFTSNADLYYRLMKELKMMALDSSSIPELYSLYLDASTFTAGIEFEEERIVYPIGIADYQYNYIDLSIAQANGLIISNGISLQDADITNGSAYSTRKCSLIAPLADYYSQNDISIIFREQDFKSNYRSLNEIQTIEVKQNGVWTTVLFDQEYSLILSQSAVQIFTVRVTYSDSTNLLNDIFINTPEFLIKPPSNKGNFSCDKSGSYTLSNIENGKIKLKYCMKKGCSNATISRPNKPYILVTGWRPPIFGQKFKRTWHLYNAAHEYLLQSLINYNYDIYLVKFNIHENPQGHGMQESAELFIRFLEQLNIDKVNPYNENIIQGSSMGADIVRLALMKMEKEHWNNSTYPHHHSRLFISHDANYYGANIPLSYQYQIYSGFYHSPPPTSIFSGESYYLRAFLYSTLKQKTLKELLSYHVEGNGFPFLIPVKSKDIEPTHDNLRTNYLNSLNQVNTGTYFIPLPTSTRNIAISLGKIENTNDNNSQGLNFKSEGQFWRNENLPGILKIKAAKYTTSGYTNLYHREQVLFATTWFPIPYLISHKVHTKYMQEVDNASGSYLKDFGNIILVTNVAYSYSPYTVTDPYDQITTWIEFFTQFSDQPLFSHKSVVTALAINENIWPSDGSMTLNMKGLGLMYNVLNFDPINDLSNHYGYPNLGRPNDHFDVTPFEAIAIDNEIDPHIDLENSDINNVLALTSFIQAEVEPWFLGLQNEVVGSQARSNYIYRARRRAKYNISVGHLVTPKTDPGDYIVNENARLKLEAGESIDVLPGTTFKQGCEATLVIEYQNCIYGKSISTNDNRPSKSREEKTLSADYQKQQFIEKSEIRIFPNPSEGTFTIVNMQNVPIYNFAIYDLSGNLVMKKKNINVARYECKDCLSPGIYIIHVSFGKNIKQLKIIIS